MLNKNSNFSPLVFALILVVGIWLGKSLSFGDFSKSEVNKFNLVLEQLEEAYVDSINKDELIEKAVANLLKELDPHSYYIKAKDLSAINEPMEGSFDGIGVEFNLLDDTILVVAPISGGPSQRVGIQSGDKIVSVDGEVIAGTGLENEDVFRPQKRPRDIFFGKFSEGVHGERTTDYGDFSAETSRGGVD